MWLKIVLFVVGVDEAPPKVERDDVFRNPDGSVVTRPKGPLR